MRTCRLLTVLCLLSLLALPASAQLGELSRGGLGDVLAQPGACGGALTADTAAAPSAAPLYFYSISDDSLTAGVNHVQIRAFVDGALYMEEQFRIQRSKVEALAERQLERMRASHPDGPDAVSEQSLARSERTVFELLGERGEIRAQLGELATGGQYRVEVELIVNGDSLGLTAWDEFAQSSGQAVAEHGLPVVTGAWAQVFSTQANPGPQGFYVCGDGSCGGGTPPTGENCESCPQDCGGPCSICGNGFCGGTETCSSCAADCGACDPCPEDLGTEERTDYLGSTSYYTYCMDAWPGTMYYTYQRNDYKTYTVQRTRECDGSITETVVPGSTSYWSAYCWKYTGVYCSFSYGYASPICF